MAQDQEAFDISNLDDEQQEFLNRILADKQRAIDFYDMRNVEFKRMENWYFKKHYAEDQAGELEDENTDEAQDHLTIVTIPTTIVDSVHGLLTDDDVDIRCLPSAGKRSEAKAQMTERFLHGTYWINRQTQGGDAWEDSALDALVYGWGCVYSYWDEERYQMSRDSKGKPKDLMDFYSYPLVVRRINPYDIYPLQGGTREKWRGMVYAIMRTKSEIEDEWGCSVLPNLMRNEETGEYEIEDLYDESLIEFIDWWCWIRDKDTKKWMLWHSVLANGQFVKEPTEMPQYELLPYEIYFCRKSMSDSGSQMGLSFLYPVIEAVQEIEFNVNRTSRILDLYADPAIVRVGALEGSETIEKGPGTIFDVDIGGDVHYLTWQGSPPDTKQIVDFWKEIAQDAYPPVMTGMQGGFSGLDTIALQQGGKLKTNKPRRNLELAVARVNSKLIRLLQQFSPDDAIWVQGERSEEDEVKPFSFSIRGKDTVGFENTIVTVHGRFPNEELRNVAIAAQAVGSGIESQRGAMEQWLYKQDPERTYDMILEEQILKDPQMAQFFMQKYMALPTQSPVSQALAQGQQQPTQPPVGMPDMATNMAGGDIAAALAQNPSDAQSAIQQTPVLSNAFKGAMGGSPATVPTGG